MDRSVKNCLRGCAGNVTLQSLKLPAHVRVVAWAPQNDIIADEAVVAFVTHGGANSLYEAAYHGTPIVCIPFFADQPDNGAKVGAIIPASIMLVFHLMLKSAAICQNAHSLISSETHSICWF